MPKFKNQLSTAWVFPPPKSSKTSKVTSLSSRQASFLVALRLLHSRTNAKPSTWSITGAYFARRSIGSLALFFRVRGVELENRIAAIKGRVEIGVFLWMRPSCNETLNQICYYTRCITPKRVTGRPDPFPRHCAKDNTALFEAISQR